MNHEKMNTLDILWEMAELEHERRHALRTARTTADKDKRFRNLVRAGQAQEYRREIQHKFDISEEEWCQAKVAMNIKQLAYETFTGDYELFEKLEDFTDDILSDILNEDMSGCSNCRADMDQEA